MVQNAQAYCRGLHSCQDDGPIFLAQLGYHIPQIVLVPAGSGMIVSCHKKSSHKKSLAPKDQPSKGDQTSGTWTTVFLGFDDLHLLELRLKVLQESSTSRAGLSF